MGPFSPKGLHVHLPTDDPTAPAMVEIPGGCVDLRDDRIGARWQVELAPFWLARVPVTVNLHRAATAAESAGSASDAFPVTNVNWFDAVDLCNKLSARHGLRPAYSRDPRAGDVIWDRAADGYRLPTEAEWQYACKAGTTGYRYGELDDIAWYADNSGGRPHDVGGKAPNPWGLFDMLGNVWEWCWDLYDEEVYGSYHIFRGGGWAEEARGCGATVRRRSHPSFAIDDLGFRLARSVSGRTQDD
ncbi:formylglycine-generating enzyme family protein [Actinopolymorpha singaporensis]|uniref:Formylglycine-generating enzyme, required for sulfatase activity, contains SUMF1/FGE domain n=1 Tax=Actinopolymorpha singaporensis TaxID=117157 RepID=A0A1H1MBP2_9ACTN|nr:SUMF1/EgtB/PvdO family nonheme iron enzyme [Actinopolymorpha singaporensis]SDR84264.1 Formylglycine-generating enzyme, required for sulfatase activity, contains SUMF1/FGE domain [Actinopolymorpha singaporensis]